MGDEVIIVSVIFSAVVAIVFMGIASDIIKTWVKSRNSKSIAENEDFLEALRNFKEKTDQRLTSLEANAAGDEHMEEGPARRSINFNDHPASRNTDPAGKNLKNMLNE